MSTATSATSPLPSTPEKIARYTAAISANLTNLISELAPAPPASTDAILRQLQIITDQLTLVNLRLDRLEQVPSAPPKDVAVVELTEWNPLTLPTPAENNARARRHNATARYNSDALLSLFNANNKRVLGFPPTLGHLAQLDPVADEHLCQAFGLRNTLHALVTFCGVNIEYARHATLYSIIHQDVILLRAHRREKRDAAVAAAGPPTAATTRASAIHNRAARAHNHDADCGDYEIVPIHDKRNLVVDGFPREFEQLIKPSYLADVLYFLGEYGQSTEAKGCVHRWETFVGVSVRDMGDCHYHTQREWLW